MMFVSSINVRIDLNKSDKSKECDICYYCYYCYYLCNDCLDLIQKAMSFNGVAIVSIKGSGCS